MVHRAKISELEKIAAVEKHLRGECSISQLATHLHVAPMSVHQWIRTYLSLGPSGLQSTSNNTSYSEEFKRRAVEDYLAGGGSLMDICQKYGIKSTRQLRNWILKYNSHERLNTSRTGGTLVMTKGRATTFHERVEIVRYCIEHQHNYAQTAERFQVSYQQVYSWTNKYLKFGVDALQDRRGKRKSEDQMSELEKLRAQNKLLQAENRRKQMEIDLLKKLDEIERRRF